ncbi:uncharacterized protein C8orf48 homolog [Heteronotia binoei]|uniref:uncharacterized protein C8orf48 homolog n=1 Tax=Heteronotia binoei TaxID=13085 RepID=UPI00292DB7BB|nr:uncharacterized protein C8orf48 homolog [Heteronotia binoei]XP_060106046.1 uncharacterized protein C8orf48 homolog [Heteronotia binoei]XP_060106047.1 uncharacterized protein C8orf48 homolog [Heteronotia binoei]XP_060106048.1 uncharacterized protein C8orf48 homolog [Heteronotia binoei]
MEASRDCSRSIPDYSEDTFASFSEEEGGSYRQYENESFESYYSGEEPEGSTGSDQSEDTWQPSSQNNEEQEPDFLDPNVSEKGPIRKWINHLKDVRPSTQLAGCTSKPGNALIKTTEVPEEELKAVQSFCAVKINRLSHLPSSELPKRHKQNHWKPGFTSEKLLRHEVNWIVPNRLVNRLQLKNFQGAMKQLAETEMHQPLHCPECEKKRAELARETFLRQKRTLMEGVLLQAKLEEHIYTKDALVLIGEIHQSLPKLSEDPGNVWQKLNERPLQV